MERFGRTDRLKGAAGETLLEPLPDIEFMDIVTGTKFIITDRSGLQERTVSLRIPLRDAALRSRAANNVYTADE